MRDIDNCGLNANEPELQGTEDCVRVLNVAASRASEVDGIYEAARRILDDLLLTLQNE